MELLELLELLGLEVPIEPLALPDPEILPEALPEMVESCDDVPADVPLCCDCDEVSPWSDPELDVAELPCDEGAELSVTLPETLELDDDELGVVEFKVPLVEPLGAPVPEVLIDVLL